MGTHELQSEPSVARAYLPKKLIVLFASASVSLIDCRHGQLHPICLAKGTEAVWRSIISSCPTMSVFQPLRI